MLGEDIHYLSVRELGDRIKNRSLSPVELTESYLQRSESIGRRLNAFATLTRELALKQARAAEKEIQGGNYRGPLHGIPYAAKDLLAVAGFPTTWGARPYAAQQFTQDATVVRLLREAGAVLLGKAAMIELAGGMGYHFASASLQGPGKNPWNEGHWTGGSSSGAGAIVAAGLAAFAIGTETWGSILCPSAFCGVSGLRPTYGRVSRHGAMALSYSMDKIGPMARTADDCALVLQAIAGHDPADTGSLPSAAATFRAGEPAKQPLRIGWLTKGWKSVAPAIDAATKEALAVLKKSGIIVSEAQLPEGPFEEAGGIIINVEGASAFDALIDSGRVAELTDPLGKIGGYANQQIRGTDFLRAQRVRGILQKKMAELFEKFDVLAAATLPVTATKIEADIEKELDFPDPLGGIGNLCGLPAISVPCGFGADKLPVGIQFVGPVLGETKVIAAAKALQQQTAWHRQRPKIQ